MSKWPASKSIALVVIYVLTLALAFAAGLGAAQVLPVSNPLAAPRGVKLDIFWQAWKLVEQDFWGALPNAPTRVYGATRGMLATLNDPYTVLVEPRQHQREKEDLQGSFGGIGVTMRRNEQGDVILSPQPESPAILAGLQEGDVLVAVDSRPISVTMSFDDIAAIVRGPVGTQVAVSVRRSGSDSPLSFTITRATIQLPSVESRIVESAPSVGYIAINRFTERSGDEVERAVNELKQQGARRLILDLRDNSGGLLNAAIDVSSQFLSDSVVLYEQQKDKPERAFRAKPGGAALDMPLVVLVNQGTASASEIVAGALRDNGRAILIGEQTFGKGSVQHIYDLSDGSSLHVTAAEWFTPNRLQLTGNGLVPDDVIARTNDDVVAGRDPQFDRAVALVQNN